MLKSPRYSTMTALPLACCLGGIAGAVAAQELEGLDPNAAEGVEYSPYIAHDFPDQVLFGDTHLHTAFSADAGLTGATLGPDDAYRFAKGEMVTSSFGVPARLQRPLDWLVVTDHAENLGLPIALEENNPTLLANAWGAKIAKIYEPRTIQARIQSYDTWMADALNPVTDPLEGTGFPEMMWPRITEAAEQHNVPGSFTAMIGFEWSSASNGNNLHRNVIFRDSKAEADQVIPFSAFDSEDVEDLWAWMAAYEEKTGGSLLSIPHNGNLSNGLMFDDVTYSGGAMTREYAEARMKYEPIYEITQIKGDSETHPALSPDDEFADYGTWDKGSFGPGQKTPEMLPREYAREAWKRGMAYEAELGVNPFKFGVVGSTDSHTALSTAQEDNYFGKVSLLEPSAAPIRFEEIMIGRYTPDDPADDIISADGLVSGIAAVWAKENTREAIWNALKRRETFATTGTRIRVRVFGGFGFQESDLDRSDFARHGYEQGVPMGGDIIGAPEGEVPGLLVRALRDPDGANLDRVQVIKGWVDSDGTSHEKVFDIAWSDDRTPGADGKLPPVGNTVDVETATYDNSIGDPLFQTFWQDPEFDAAQSAFYYVRVIEIPTPRWTTYDHVIFGVDLPKNHDPFQQERAYTSPIWYTPS